MPDRPLSEKIALVTGATRGIGAATAVALAAAGAHVIATGRTEGALEELDDAIKAVGGSATLVPLDMKDVDGIDRLGGALYERYGRLDVFVGNAGVLGPLTPLGHVFPKDWDDIVAVNLTANWRCVRSFDPLLRLSTTPRAVFVSSGAAHKARAYWGPYAITKAGLEVLARTWAAEHANANLKVNLFNPGPIATRMRAKAFPGEDPATLPSAEAAAAAIVPLCLPACEETGRLYDFPTKRFLDFQMPA
ncbi:SDR family NAD(P)-dependent oxidoreductase [Xanthobacter tagetidis]|uniref:SDR family NAD(P)-dependent oxidoreductase n=1 Tax=Xanthobacter tagetidis TaxID=60216 RepID=A0A3L7ALV0_9HYPH|nr:SDR family NAD(P)-dependent oxidoreductase [Xanthobacter tagetidis]MBB6307796.1 NAD(P)-dependent dehydrogenase (short-subunit alcohol dehydrogenase family) [Xanthobacter tagetidis]RLP81463.1 SDR family NAD(P)-dependent oxidoreductase [Xanthobacter tagetidis]